MDVSALRLMPDANLDGDQRATTQARQQRRATWGRLFAYARWRRGTAESEATVSRGHAVLRTRPARHNVDWSALPQAQP